MLKQIIERSQIKIHFLPYGSSAPESLKGSNQIYLDVGNGLRIGVIDQHQLSSFSGSSAELLAQNTSFLMDAISENFGPTDQFTIFIHQKPDFDCLLSAWLTIKILGQGALPSNTEGLLFYSSEIDEGKLGASRQNPYSLYSAYMILVHRLSMRRWKTSEDLYLRQITQGFELLDYIYEQILIGDVDLLDLNAFMAPGLFSPMDEALVTEDLERYERKLRDPNSHARSTSLQLSGLLGGRKTVAALFVRNVQNLSDPERVIHFKDWARSDLARAGEDGFIFLSVYSNDGETGLNRCIISVQPDKRVYLKGLGTKLEEAEVRKRIHQNQIDDRCTPDEKDQIRPNRLGYHNPDPWYDGRGHCYTIIDSPRGGTILTADEVEGIILEYAQSSLDSFTNISEIVADQGLSQHEKLTLMTQASRDAKSLESGKVQQSTPKIFISYAHKDQDWVIEHIYTPLKNTFGEDHIFFDQMSLKGGSAWFMSLSRAIESCDVFLPVYSKSFFESDFCTWEIQQALFRDPCGKREIILPISMDEIEIPRWIGHVQSSILRSHSQLIEDVQMKLTDSS